MSLAGHEIAVPGSTANLGAGFDTLGLALQIYLRLRIEAELPGERGRVDWRFVGPAPPGENFLERGLRAGLAGTSAFTGLRVSVTSEIPMRSGLGSSAAALVAGLRLASLLSPSLGDDQLLAAATRLEGHPDNVSASILGGLTISCVGEDGRVHALRARWPEAWRLVIATPHLELETELARAVLPRQVPMSAAVANIQRAALLVQAVNAVDARVVREALRDRLHQPYRAALVPGLERALALDVPPLVGVFLSGAGPSIAAIVEGRGAEVGRAFEALYRDLGLEATIRFVGVHQPPAS